MDATRRKRQGAWYTPLPLVESVVEAAIDERVVARAAGRPVRVVDPACGDGRFLAAAATRIESLGGRHDLTGYDVDGDALAEATRVVPAARLVLADALGAAGPAADDRFDVVVGNPPFLSQLAAETTRGASSEHGGGPYADAAVEFLALAATIVQPDGGRVAFVLPQSVLASRDAGPVRARYDDAATMIWSAWTGRHEFDAQVVTCAVAFEFGSGAATPVAGPERSGSWSNVVTDRVGVPALPIALTGSGPTLGDRAWLNANFRDEYYGMVPAVGDHTTGPPLVTSGAIDPGRCHWGERSVRFAKRRFDAPRIDLEALDVKMRAWADRRLVPKVLVANQTPILEAVADPTGDWLPGVPVVSIYPTSITDGADPGDAAREIAALLTSPSASVWAWHERGGTGLSADTIRVGPAMLAGLPWPSGDLTEAVVALGAGDVVGCGQAVDRAYGIAPDECALLAAWWRPIVERIERRAGAPTG